VDDRGGALAARVEESLFIRMFLEIVNDKVHGVMVGKEFSCLHWRWRGWACGEVEATSAHRSEYRQVKEGWR
jgi:hypothetical protein